MNKNKTILVGISGGIDSFVAAYVLKRQGYNIVGVSILFVPKEEEKNFKGVYLIKELDKIKTVCSKIGIPFHTISAQELYNSQVNEFIIASKLTGQHFSPELVATNLILEILYSKMKEQNAQKIATGHYARIIHDGVNNCYNIYASKDNTNNQGHYLAFMPREVLPHLELPLARMRREEVEKVALALNLEIPDHREFSPFMYSTLKSFVKNKPPPPCEKRVLLLIILTNLP